MKTSIARPLVKFGAQLGVIAMLAAGLSGCETIASLDPTGLLSDDSAQAATPDLASIPAAPTVGDDQRDVADSLAAAGQQTQYSADALRAGTEAAAPAPSAAPPVPSTLASNAPPTANDAPPTASDIPPSASPSAPIPVAGNPAPALAAAAPRPVPVPVANNPNAAVPAVPPPDSVPGRLASMAPSAPAPRPAPAAAALPPGAEPAVPAVPPAGAVRSTLMTPVAMSDSALGFKPSGAPPLDTSVSNFVSAPILARYKQTSGGGSGGSAAASAVIAGAIAASNGGVPPTAIVYFPGDGTALNTAARAQIRAAVAAFKADGSSGSVRVVGHASSRTANMPVERHLELIFEKSQKRANAVAQELIHQGIPADHVQIDAVGDSQPIYYESMPRGEDGNRRAEIFVNG